MRSVLIDNTEITPIPVYRGMPHFPGRIVALLGDKAPLSLWTAGNADLVGEVDSGQAGSVALAASVNSPASIADGTWDLVRDLAEGGAVLVGGFHSPLERLCLDRLAAAGRPAIVCLARTLQGFRIPAGWVASLRSGKLVLVSACEPTHKRATRNSVAVRNDCVVSLADCFFVSHARPGGKTEALCQAVLKTGKEVWTLTHPSCGNLVSLGAKLASAGNVSEILHSGRRRLAASLRPGK